MGWLMARHPLACFGRNMDDEAKARRKYSTFSLLLLPFLDVFHYAAPHLRKCLR